MANNVLYRIKKFAKKRLLQKGIRLAVVLLISYSPAGAVGRIIKLLTSKWLLNVLIKRLT
ncbi:hypothetical protein CYG50_07255 [Providencia huaxiensis]|nr:hypothetical protein CYG50_07255 [Providencia huaxiensis]